MLNQFVIVGKINAITKNDISVIVTSKIKDSNSYIEDTVHIKVSENLRKCREYMCVNSLIGIKGRITSGNILQAEKITFLDSAGVK